MYSRGGREKNDNDVRQGRKKHVSGFLKPLSTSLGEYIDGSTRVTEGERNTLVYDRSQFSRYPTNIAPGEPESFVSKRLSDPILRRHETDIQLKNKIGTLLEMHLEDDQAVNLIDNLKPQSYEENPAQIARGRLMKVFSYDLKSKIQQAFSLKPE